MSLALSIVIFTRDDADHLGRCLSSLATDPPAVSFETIVIDNASNDDTAEVTGAAAVGARHVHLAEETSFSVGNNIGLREARGEWVLFLNPDTLPTGDVLDRCVAALEDGGWGLVSPRLRYPDGSHQPTGWHLPSPSQLVRERLAGVSREVPMQDAGVTEVGWLMGCFLMGRRSTLTERGGFDEAFWFHGTDLEICAGFAGGPLKVGRVEEATMVHVGHRGWDAERRGKSQAALVQWLRRDHGATSAEVVGAAAALVEAMRS